MPELKEENFALLQSSLNLPATRLKVSGFGPAEVIADQVKNLLLDWNSRKSLELFYYLLHHPEGARRDLLWATFWPEMRGDRARDALTSTCYRVRKAIGDKDVVLHQQGVYTINPVFEIHYDVRSFEDFFQRSMDAENEYECASLCEEAVNLYKDPFMEGFDS